MTRPGVTGLFVALLLGSGSEPLWAQSRSTVVGTLRDATGAPQSGLTVTLRDASGTGPTLTAVTNDRGAYRFGALEHGTYELIVHLNGRQVATRANVRVLLGATSTLDIALSADETRHTPGRNDAAPMIDVTTASSTTRLTAEDLHNLPLASGAALLQLAPGVTPRTAFGNSMDTTELRADGGTISVIGRGGLSTAGFDPYWMEEAEIGGPGAGAEYGEFTGVFANIAIRSGTNRHAGQLEYRGSPSDWVGDNTDGLPEALRSRFRPAAILSRWDASAQAGGPIDRQHLYFFSGVHYSLNRVRQAGTIPLPDGSEVAFDERSPALLTKLTWIPSRGLRVDGFVQANRLRAVGRLNPDALPETANDQTTSMRSWNARATWLPEASTTLDVHVSGVGFDFTGIPESRRAGPPPHADDNGPRSGNVTGFQDRFARRVLASATLTKFLEGRAALSHTIKTGFEFERATHRRSSGIPGGQSFKDKYGIPYEVELWAGDAAAGTGTRTTVFFEDSWNAGHGLTIEPGLRLSVNRGSVPEHGVVLKTSPASLRVGMAWDVLGDHRTVVRTSYGRLHEGLTPTVFDFMSTSGRTPHIFAKVVGQNEFEELNRVTPEGNVGIDDGLAHAYIDQAVVGIERQWFRDLAVSVQYIGRKAGKVWGLVDPRSEFSPMQVRDSGPDNKIGTPDDGDLLTVFDRVNPGEAFSLLTNLDGASRRYHAVQLVAQKRFAKHWQLLAAYTWSTTRGNLSTVSRDLAVSSSDNGSDGPFLNPNRRINADGPVQFDYTHQLNVQGVYQLPAWGGVTVSAGLASLSGGPVSRTIRVAFVHQDSQFVRVAPRGAQRLDDANIVDLRVEKAFGLGSPTRSVSIYVDVLNLTNGSLPLAQTVNEQSGAKYLEPNDWAAPRTMRVAARFTF